MIQHKIGLSEGDANFLAEYGSRGSGIYRKIGKFGFVGLFYSDKTDAEEAMNDIGNKVIREVG